MAASCGCKGVRFCASCKDSDRVKNLREKPEDQTEKLSNYLLYVYKDGKCYHRPELRLQSTKEEIEKATEEVSTSSEASFSIDGIDLLYDFLDEKEELAVVEEIDKKEWVLSQSGRRKQDYGPKVNFKHKKVRPQFYEGLPTYADLILERLRSINDLKYGNYQPFELCNLEYDQERQSGIELHKDDMWIWGNRLISLNLLDGSVMCFANEEKNALVFLHMPRRSLLCFRDESRFNWTHGIFPWHITNRRIALTMREPSQIFQEGGELFEKYGKELIERGNRRIPA
uniref:DNA N6-methyl adenine demethylase n=1 Tax=Bursaphelenchus xylophilus TaxID=6326 RepID=A0A6M8DG12_BURXY|nr:DNA N6-methyl adenine demethylase [Bursaphelenchus xylophilus]